MEEHSIVHCSMENTAPCSHRLPDGKCELLPMDCKSVINMFTSNLNTTTTSE